MRGFRSLTGSGTRAITAAIALGVSGALAPALASASFQLTQPTPWIVEDKSGDPQSAAPCGVDPLACYTPTGAVTSFTAGQEITINWQETVPADGWYRISLSTHNRQDLSDPAVVVNDAGLSVDANILPLVDQDAAPLGITTYALPLLADGIFVHAATDIPGVPYQYTWNVVLPTGVTCERCTIQVTQFLGNHSDNLPASNPNGYFAHHCADVTILPADDAGDASFDPAGALSIAGDAGQPSASCVASRDSGISEDAGDSTAAESSSDAGSPEGASADDSAAIDQTDGTMGVADDGGADESGDDAESTSADDGGSGDAIDGQDEGGGDGGDASATSTPSGGGGGGCGCVASGSSRGASALVGVGVLVGFAAMARRQRRSRQ